MSSAPYAFVARHPILDRNREVHGYELLHRSGWDGVFRHQDPDKATLELLNASMLVNRLQDLTDHKLAFVNVTENLLHQDVLRVVPTEHTVLELLETIRPTPDVVEAVAELHDLGHRIAVDDFTGGEDWAPIVEMADYLKVDFRAMDADQRRAIVERYARPGLRFLAEKIETHEEFQEALDTGYDLFQGFFFCKPETSARRELPQGKVNYLQFLQEISRTEPDIDRLTDLIKREISLSAKLLRYINSVHFGIREEMTSIRQALIHLGERPLKRWGTLIALAGLGDDKPIELIRTCLVRARFCEQLAGVLDLNERSLYLFLTGMFSALDALTDRPLEEALNELGVDREIQGAIEGEATDLGRAFALAQACERGDDRLYRVIAGHFGLAEDQVAQLWTEALLWADAAFAPQREAA
jgi:EAL and modified HD-GYP domain-containing signal transduction protein